MCCLFLRVTSKGNENGTLQNVSMVFLKAKIGFCLPHFRTGHRINIKFVHPRLALHQIWLTFRTVRSRRMEVI